MPLLFGALLRLALGAAGVTGTVLAMLMGKLLLALLLAAFTAGVWLRFKRSGVLANTPLFRRNIRQRR